MHLIGVYEDVLFINCVIVLTLSERCGNSFFALPNASVGHFSIVLLSWATLRNQHC